MHVPGHCRSKKNAKAERDAVLKGMAPGMKTGAFLSQPMPESGRQFTVLIPPSSQLTNGKVDTNRPPVVLLEELPTISAGLLELAERLGRQKYAVYVPVLFGNERENPNSLQMKLRPFGFVLGRPDWQANAEVAHRKIVGDLAALCREIAGKHPGKRMGVIGLCLTGSFPLELLVEPGAPPIAAPVISQPSIPILPMTFCSRQSLGMPEAKLQKIKKTVEQRKLEVLGFRAELDPISPPERFANLRSLLGASFIDATLPASGYVYQDRCPPNSHAVLTDMFRPYDSRTLETQGHFAWRRLVWFLGQRLEGTEAGSPRFNDSAQLDRHRVAETAASTPGDKPPGCVSTARSDVPPPRR